MLVDVRFRFIGAQKHGKYVKSLIEPKAEPSIEDTVLHRHQQSRISAGPSGPPTDQQPVLQAHLGQGSWPPAAGPTSPPEQAPAAEPAPEPEPAPEAAPPAEDVYEDQGDGWFFRKFPDGTYDQQVYVIKDGLYVPYEDPNA